MVVAVPVCVHLVRLIHKRGSLAMAVYNAYLDSPLACQIFFLPRQAWEPQSLVLNLQKKKVSPGWTLPIRTMVVRGGKEKKF